MFFVKYNDPIYVKLEKLDIMIRLASQANIAQVHVVRGLTDRAWPRVSRGQVMTDEQHVTPLCRLGVQDLGFSRINKRKIA